MDIQYLLWLQGFRNSIQDAWTPFMEWVSMFATTYLIMFAVFYYWNRDKRDGLYVLVSYYFCMVMTPLIKLTACVYRPWIRDSRILPAGDAISTATGYSFPSGHTTTAGPLSGGMAVIFWKNKHMRWLSVIFALYVLLTAFSRNYLGVHTPQDVCVAMLISVLSLFLAAKLFAYLDEHPEKENLLLLGGFVFCWLAIAYITFKPYPMDLNGEGKLIVDPQKMMNDGYGDLGKMMGFIIARFIEKTWIKFKPLDKGWKSVVICLIGLIPMALLKTYLNPLMVQYFGSHWGKLFFSVIYVCYYIALFPLVLTKIRSSASGSAA
ncbi:MAG: phosphatase PAP2 family protein [Lachnospiraceae bacterium]|nr:phosphatase PAP2 family protein [Lachnospiraceae bacterium]